MNNLPKYVMILTKNAEFEIGVLLNISKKVQQDAIVYKCFIYQSMGKDKPKLEISYEQEYMDHIRNTGGIINETQYKIIDFEPYEIVDIFEEKIQKKYPVEVTLN